MTGGVCVMTRTREREGQICEATSFFIDADD